MKVMCRCWRYYIQHKTNNVLSLHNWSIVAMVFKLDGSSVEFHEITMYVYQ